MKCFLYYNSKTYRFVVFRLSVRNIYQGITESFHLTTTNRLIH